MFVKFAEMSAPHSSDFDEGQDHLDPRLATEQSDRCGGDSVESEISASSDIQHQPSHANDQGNISLIYANISDLQAIKLRTFGNIIKSVNPRRILGFI